MKKLLLIGFLIISLPCDGQTINISLYNDHSVTSFVFTVLKGSYDLKEDEHTIYTLTENENIYISLINNSIIINGKRKVTESYDKLRFEPNEHSIMQIRPVNPVLKSRRYKDKLEISVDFNRIKMINTLGFNTYLAGVVEAEGGPSAFPEYYKAQALLCRTYAVDNHDRHLEEGFHLCDGTHCQAFKGLGTSSKTIEKAVESTNDMVVVDSAYQFITAAYHSNSGGITEDAMNVWLQNMPYLKSFPDPYSLKGRNTSWEKTINRQQWENYLINHDLKFPVNNYTQINDDRQASYVIGNIEIPYSRIRKDWNLRSSFFSIHDDGDRVLLKGKGYGHGVGMSQEGAMEMARRGHTFKEIIHFYFKNVSITTLYKISLE
jgi:stage II sporulation protein D